MRHERGKEAALLPSPLSLGRLGGIAERRVGAIAGDTGPLDGVFRVCRSHFELRSASLF